MMFGALGRTTGAESLLNRQKAATDTVFALPEKLVTQNMIRKQCEGVEDLETPALGKLFRLSLFSHTHHTYPLEYRAVDVYVLG